mgnify:CR=1 FL=1
MSVGDKSEFECGDGGDGNFNKMMVKVMMTMTMTHQHHNVHEFLLLGCELRLDFFVLERSRHVVCPHQRRDAQHHHARMFENEVFAVDLWQNRRFR